MNGLIITQHAEARMSRRGIRVADLAVFFDYATDIGDGRFMLRERDAKRAMSIRRRRTSQPAMSTGAFKRWIAMVERLIGKVVVIVGNRVITAYHQASRSWTRDEARRARRRDRAQ